MKHPKVLFLPIAVALMAPLLCPLTSSAAEPAATDADREQARELLARGTEAIRNGDYEAARRSLARALGLFASYDIAIALGQAELKGNRYVEAARHLEYALNQFPPSESRTLKQKVEEYLNLAKQHVATLQINVVPPGAAVLIDGAAVPTDTGPTQFVAPGAHVIEAKSDSGFAEPQTVEVSAGEERTINLEVKTRATPTEPTATTATPEPLPLEPETTPPPAEPQDPLKSLVPVYVGAGLTAVGLGTWIGFGLAAGDAADEARELRDVLGSDGCSTNREPASQCQQARDTLDRQRRNATVSNAGLGLSIVGGVATLGYLFLWPDPEPVSAYVMPRVVVGKQSTIVELSGEF